MSLINEQCNKVCKIIDDVLANRPAKRDSLIVAVRKAFEALGHLPSAQHWIPCSERLPNDNDYKECVECLDGAVWYFTKNGTMGLGYYYESTKQWSTTADLKTDGKVIAWQPLPSPYREEQ